MSSSSVGATKEAIQKVLVENGHEPEVPEVEAPVEPKREEFESDEAFEQAQEEFTAAQEEAEEKEEDEAERKRLEALPKKSRRQRAVEKATKELQETNRKLEERLAALESGKGGTKKEEPKAEAPKAPKREDFKSDQEYDDALFDYRYQVRRAKEQQEEAKKRQEEASKQIETQLKANFEDYKTAVGEFKEGHDDWDEVVNNKVPISEPVYYAIVDLGKEGPPVTYYLGQHPEELDRLAQLTPYRAAIEVGRLADKLKNRTKRSDAETQRKPAPKRIPEPVRPVSSSATSSSLTSREAAQKRDFKAFKAAQRRGA